MLRKIKLSLIGLVTALVLGISSLSGVALAAPSDAVCEGIGAATAGAGCGDDTDGATVNSAITTVIDILSWLVGVVAVIMVIYGGFRYVTSGGDSGKLSSAKNTILYALIGIFIVALAQTLVFFVIGRASGSQSSGSPSQGNGSNLCRVDSRGNFVSNPDPSRQCAMP